MRMIIMTAAAAVCLNGAAMAKEAKHHRHPTHQVSATTAEGAAPADSMSPHQAHMMNLQESGYDSHKDLDAAGNERQN